jgi:hypothetical protein
MKISGKIPAVFLALHLFGNTSSARQPDYKEIFGQDWKKADQFVITNRNWIEPLLEKHNIEFNEAIAVVFPELVRYSALQDKIEVTLLKALYINLGEDYANFSIGQFQIKPSFAETLSDLAQTAAGRKEKNMLKRKSDFGKIRSFRAAIVSDLENTAEQLKYLIVFIKVCEKKFNLRNMESLERIKFLATAYNYNFLKSEQEIVNMADKKFYSAKLFDTESYSYSDISLFWYSHNQKVD